MKNIITILLLLLLSFFSFILNNIFYSDTEYIKVLKEYSSPEYMITQTLLDDYLLNMEDKASKNMIADRVLRSIGYLQWLEYIDYIEVLVYQSSIMPQEEPQLIVVLNLTKDFAVAAVFEKNLNHYVYVNHIENLVKVESLQFIPLPQKDYHMMLIYQILDESFGGFFYEKFVDVYNYIGDDFKEVWQKTLYYEEIYNESWINPNGAKDKWFKVIEESVIDFSLNYPLKVNTITTFKKYIATSEDLPMEEVFSLTESNSFTNTYIWEEEYQTFIIGEIPASIFPYKVAIIEDMENDIYEFYGIKNDNFKLKTSLGDILYIPKSNLENMLKTTN
ncbi:hypothetical protein [Alkaliphilus serpentinus]|uniref:Uncharacterized protein n=1 Tax=Alkaliphilus serpentinus TaxID=1482731 RepID=A0A833HPH0_9FIRM|nr:hypothetical protein [Alkaliphilus serpentinus]KAB3530721.1 hypothetical protein F8153_06325 [Alkaliphilus serpentinus]